MILIVLVGLRAWFVGPMWLDESFVSFGYSDRIARGYGPFLPGQDLPYEAFSNPLWVGFFGLVGSLNLSETKVQEALSVLMSVLLTWLAFRAAQQRTGKHPAFWAVLLLGLAPVAVAARDGGDSVWLALLSLWAAASIAKDLKSAKDRPQSTIALALLSWSGWLGLMASLGLASLSVRLGRWRNLMVVGLCFGLLTVLRWLLFKTVIPPVLSMPEGGWDVFAWMPGMCALSLVGLVASWRIGRPFLPYAVILVSTWIGGFMGGQPAHGFGVALIPAVGVMVVLIADTIDQGHSKWWWIVIGLLMIGHDLKKGEAALSSVRQARLTNYFQGRGMGRFLLWRFNSEDRIIVHRPGVVSYYARRPVTDMSGRLHKNRPTPEQALEANPVAVLPEKSIVSQKAQRLELGDAWSPMLERHYKQYAIQHQKAWQMVDFDPVWFHIYIRKDLPMLRPDIPESNGNILPRADPFGAP